MIVPIPPLGPDSQPPQPDTDPRGPPNSDIASTRSRVNAMLIDALILIPSLGLDLHLRDAESTVVVFVYFFLSQQVDWAYRVAFHGWRGQTLGKKLIGIRIVRHPTRERLGWGRAVVRDLPYIALVVVATSLWALPWVAYFFGQNTDDLNVLADRLLDWVFAATMGWWALEYLTMIVHPQRRAIHDLLAGSIVVRTGSAADLPAAGTVLR